MSNVASQLSRQLSPAHLELLRRASEVCAEHRVGLFLVGGTVRDILSRSRPIDLDLVMVSSPPGFASRFAEGIGGEVVAQSEFETSKLRVGENLVDLAAARTESYAHPGALPTVAPGAIDEDLARRDFSVNAMAVSLREGAWGDLVDRHHGRRDLRDGLIRVLHAGSFVDDATRILRAVRYAYRGGFRIEDETERLLRRDLGHLGGISGDRVRHEIERNFREPRAADMLRGAQELGVLSAIHPSLSVTAELLVKLGSVPIEPTPENDLRLLALLTYSVPASEVPALIGRLNMGSRWARVVRDVVGVREVLTHLAASDIRRSRVFGLLRHLEGASIEGCALAADEPLVRERLELYLRELRHVRPFLRGDDLIALGVPEGPVVGKLLDQILAARLDGLLTTREEEETLVIRSLERTDL